MTRNGQISLVNKLEKGWRLAILEDEILSKLRSLEKELLSREQSLLSYKQDRISNIVFAFTIISLTGVTAGVVSLTPLTKMFKDKPVPLLFDYQLAFVVVTTGLVIGTTFYFAMKSYGLRKKLSRQRERIKQKVYGKRSTVKIYNDLIEDVGLYADREIRLNRRTRISNEVVSLYRDGRISKRDFDQMRNNLEYLDKALIFKEKIIDWLVEFKRFENREKIKSIHKSDLCEAIKSVEHVTDDKVINNHISNLETYNQIKQTRLGSNEYLIIN